MNIIVVGAGGGMASGHSQYLREESFRVVGVEIDEARAERVRERLGIELFSTIEEACDRYPPDGFCIATPDPVHKANVVEVARYGKPIFCEKPMATSWADCVAISEAVTDIPYQLGLCLRHSRLFTRSKEIVASGELGAPVNMFMNYTPGGWGDNPESWRLENDGPDFMFTEKLCHYYDLLRWYLDAPVERVYTACSRNTTRYYSEEVCDNVNTTVEFADRRVAHLAFYVNKCAEPQPAHVRSLSLREEAELYYDFGHRLEFSVICEGGSIMTDWWSGSIKVMKNRYHGRNKQVMDRVEDHSTEHFAGGKGVYEEQVHFARVVRGEAAPYPDLAESLESMRLTFAASLSRQRPAIVTMEDVGRGPGGTAE